MLLAPQHRPRHGLATSRSLFHADYSTHGAKSGSRHFIKAASRRALAGSCQRCPFFGSRAVELKEACSAPSTWGAEKPGCAARRRRRPVGRWPSPALLNARAGCRFRIRAPHTCDTFDDYLFRIMHRYFEVKGPHAEEHRSNPNRTRVERIRVEWRAIVQGAGCMNRLIWRRSIESNLAQGNRISAKCSVCARHKRDMKPQAGYETRSDGSILSGRSI